jgi:FkbM family methyltransferase
VAAIAAGAGLPRRRLALDYLRLRTGGSRIFGHDVAFADHEALVHLFEEVWLLRHYPFRPTRSDPVVVDCGANIGVATLYFKALAPQARVIAFEPEPTAFRLLTANVRDNRLADVTCLPYALAAVGGEVTLRSPAPAHGGSSIVLGDEAWEASQVQAVPLSEHLPERVDFVKVDIEGAELDVLGELSASGAIDRIEQLAVEHHPTTPDSLPRLLGLLSDHGFAYRLALVGERFWNDDQLLVVDAYRDR